MNRIQDSSVVVFTSNKSFISLDYLPIHWKYIFFDVQIGSEYICTPATSVLGWSLGLKQTKINKTAVGPSFNLAFMEKKKWHYYIQSIHNLVW